MGYNASNYAVSALPRFTRQIPNLITCLRLLLVIPVALALVEHRLVTVLGLFGLAAVSDAADGFLAKRFGWQSEFGAILDPVADKMLFATVFIMLGIVRLIPLWLMAAAVARDGLIVLGAGAYRYFIGPVKARPSLISKLNTACQACFVLAVIAREHYGLPAGAIVDLLGALVFLTVVVSGIDYVMVYGRRAAQ